jgi:hypothetical protein
MRIASFEGRRNVFAAGLFSLPEIGKAVAP